MLRTQLVCELSVIQAELQLPDRRIRIELRGDVARFSEPVKHTAKALNADRVNMLTDVSESMINNSVNLLACRPSVGLQGVHKELSAGFRGRPSSSMDIGLFTIDDVSVNGPARIIASATRKKTYDHLVAGNARANGRPLAATLRHVLCPPYLCDLIRLKLAATTNWRSITALTKLQMVRSRCRNWLKSL